MCTFPSTSVAKAIYSIAILVLFMALITFTQLQISTFLICLALLYNGKCPLPVAEDAFLSIIKEISIGIVAFLLDYHNEACKFQLIPNVAPLLSILYKYLSDTVGIFM